MSQQTPQTVPPSRETLGCGGTVAIFAVGLGAIIIPLLGPVSDQARAEAFETFWPSLLPGAIVGFVAAIRRRLRERRNEFPRSSLAGTAMWPFGVAGYTLVTFLSPPLLGVMSGFGSGCALAFSIAWAATFFMHPLGSS